MGKLKDPNRAKTVKRNISFPESQFCQDYEAQS